jgi:hypothetical protein
MPAVMAAAPLTDPLPGGIAADQRLDHAAVRAAAGVLAGGARLAHGSARCAVKRYPGPAAPRAAGHGERGRAAGGQFGGQPPGHRWGAVAEHVGVGGQRRGQVPQHCGAGDHRIHRGGGHAGGQRPFHLDYVLG